MDNIKRQAQFAFGTELIVDLFAGGGGASLGIEQAFGRDVDVAINHNPVAIAVHTANHARTRHYCEDVFAVDPAKAVGSRPVGLLHASPDCTHHSQARGGQPRSAVIRALSWVVLKWAGRVRPRVITLENVEQILHWSPLVAKREKCTRRCVRLDGSVAAPGERTPIDQQFLVPCTRRRGKNWQHFVGSLRAMGYAVQWRKLRACDYGAPTSRERLFMVARCDGAPIRWPAPTHGKGTGLLPFRTAADCIDWALPAASIFGRKKDLAEATHRRIARGIKRFVIDAAEPFIVPITHTGSDRVHASSEPLRTVTGANRGELAACVPYLVPRYGERDGQEPRTLPADAPSPTVVPTGNGASLVCPVLVQAAHGEGKPGAAPRWGTGAHDVQSPVGTILASGGSFALMMAYIEQAAGGPNSNGSRPRAATEPVSTITQSGSQQQLVTAHLMHASTSNTNGGRGEVTKPLKTILAGGTHNALIECTLSPEQEAGAQRVAAFLMKYHGSGGQWAQLRDPAPTVTVAECLALVTVLIKGDPWVIVDIGLRMLTPQELKRCQGFPDDYVIDRTADGKPVTKTNQVKLIGNSVSPHPLRALVLANCGALIAHERSAAA